jgi:hypothetical protein
MSEKLKRIVHIFVLTPEEKRVVAFIALMILVGVSVKEYRKRHPVSPVPAEAEKHLRMRKLPPLSSSTPIPSITPRAANDVAGATPRPKRTRTRYPKTPAASGSPPDDQNDDE